MENKIPSISAGNLSGEGCRGTCHSLLADTEDSAHPRVELVQGIGDLTGRVPLDVELGVNPHGAVLADEQEFLGGVLLHLAVVVELTAGLLAGVNTDLAAEDGIAPPDGAATQPHGRPVGVLLLVERELTLQEFVAGLVLDLRCRLAHLAQVAAGLHANQDFTGLRFGGFGRCRLGEQARCGHGEGQEQGFDGGHFRAPSISMVDETKYEYRPMYGLR